jgi:transcriptional regulator with XRE-family HTH domain
LDTFAKQPKFTLALLRPRELPKGYPIHIKTIGEHIRKRRLDLGLLQIEVARQIGVTESTVWNWEHGTEPELKHMPAILAFLEYVPWEEPEEAVGRLAHFKKVNGLSFKRLGVLIGRAPEQLEDWLSGRHIPCKRNIRQIQKFLLEGEAH